MKTTKSILIITMITLCLSMGVFAKDKKQGDPLPTAPSSVEKVDPRDKQLLEMKISVLSERIEKLQAQYAVTTQELVKAKAEYQAFLKKEKDNGKQQTTD